jgi:bifunctional UDP-N-acetylglucosamine pyrophosphorylase / glucosamine-1-phosphate N-acetyltransferase
MIKVVILAAGKGTRMKHELPKLLVPVKDKPIIEHLVKAIVSSGVDDSPIVVVSPDNKELTSQALANYNCQYAVQDKQLGTGHAFACALSEIKGEVDHVISFYGDHPLVRPETIKSLATRKNGVLTMVTTVVPDFNDWRHNFYHWGRIVRYNGQVEAIVEFKDATEEVRDIKEVNPGFYCFEYEWLKKNINKLKNKNVQQEYYITDLVQIAFNQGIKIDTFAIDPKEAIGINSKEELEVAESLIAD